MFIETLILFSPKLIDIIVSFLEKSHPLGSRLKLVSEVVRVH